MATRRSILFGISSLALSAASAADRNEKALLGYDWAYDNAGTIEPPLDILLGSAGDLSAWINNVRPALTAVFGAVPLPAPISVSDGQWQATANGLSLLQVTAEYAPGVVKPGGPTPYVGALIGRPDNLDPSKPLIIALHGHEAPHRGDPPIRLWLDHWWPEALTRAGYIVITPSHLPYAQFSNLYGVHDYHVVWTRFIWLLVQACLATPSGVPPFSGMACAGLSSGGTTGALLMAWRPEITKGVFAGSFLPIEFLRRNYRIAGHPNQWNLRNVYSYLPYYLLLADREVQWQLGKADAFYPDHTAFPSNGGNFAGTDRDVMVTEILGEYLPVRDAAAKLGGRVELCIHDGGHDFKVPQALTFLAPK